MDGPAMLLLDPRLGSGVVLERLREVADARIEVPAHHRLFGEHREAVVDDGGVAFAAAAEIGRSLGSLPAPNPPPPPPPRNVSSERTSMLVGNALMSSR